MLAYNSEYQRILCTQIELPPFPMRLSDRSVRSLCTTNTSILETRARPRLGVTVKNRLSYGNSAASSFVSNPGSPRSTPLFQSDCTSLTVALAPESVIGWPQSNFLRSSTMKFSKSSSQSSVAPNRLSLPQQPMSTVHSLGQNEDLYQDSPTTNWLQGGSNRCNPLPDTPIPDTPSTVAANTGYQLSSSLTSFDGCPIKVSRPRIATNPNYRRRFTADGTPLGKPTSYHTGKQMAGVYSPRTSLFSKSMATLEPVQEPSGEVNSFPDGPKNQHNTDRQSNFRSSKMKYRRCSTGNMKASNVKEQSQKRGTRLLEGLQKSARQTFLNVRQAISAISKPSTPKHNDSKSSSFSTLDRLWRKKRKSTATQSLTMDTSIKQQPTDNAKPRINKAYRSVRLTRSQTEEPFGLRVLKSSQGFIITRISEALQRSTKKQLRIGDEILSVNGLHCTDLSLTQLTKMLQELKYLHLLIYPCATPKLISKLKWMK